VASIVGSVHNGSSNNPTTGDCDVSSISFITGDIGIFFWYARDSTKTITEPGTVTEKHDFAGGAGFGRLFIGYRYLQVGDTIFTWTASSVTTVTTLWGVTIVRSGPQSGDPFAAVAGPSTYTDTLSPNPPAVTPPVNDSLILTCFGANNDHTTVTAPTNYTLRSNGSSTLGTDGSYAAASRVLVGGGGASEDPAVFTRTGGAATDDGVVWTGAVSPGAIPKTIAAVAVPVATLTRLNTFSRTLAAVAVPVATLTKRMYVTMSATATGVATLVTALLFSVSAAAVAVGVATLTTVATFTKILAAVAVGVASLTATFIAGAAAVVARVQGFIVNVGSMMMRR